MKYPKWITKESEIGIISISDGVTNPIKQKRLDFAKEQFKKRKFQVVESKIVRKSKKGKCATSKEQAKELIDFLENPKIDWIICATGGDFACEILPEIKEEKLIQNPKWIEGYSDPTCLLFYLTTKFDIATIYGSTMGNFGMQNWHISLENNLRILQGEKLVQTNFESFEKESIPYKIGNEEYHLDTPVKYKEITGISNFQIEGRLIGGCIDCLINICGTTFDHTKEFLERYKEDGFIWYFDNAQLDMESLRRGLWQLKHSGWFSYTKAFLFGRSYSKDSYYGLKEEETILEHLKDYHVPILTEMDFGHVPPRLTFINGAFATITYTKEKTTIKMDFKS